MSELRTNRIVPRDGIPTDAYSGGIVQVSFARLTSAITLTSSTEILTGTITPTRSDSKILVDVRIRTYMDYSSGSSSQWYAGVQRKIGGGSYVWVSGKGENSTSGNELGRYAYHINGTSGGSHNPGIYMMVRDVPATTSQLTYSLLIGNWGTANGSVRLNRQTGDHEQDGAQMIMYEVSG